MHNPAQYTAQKTIVRMELEVDLPGLAAFAALAEKLEAIGKFTYRFDRASRSGESDELPPPISLEEQMESARHIPIALGIDLTKFP